ncbi:hypothetical protein D3C87_86070 [compost metagenome]
MIDLREYFFNKLATDEIREGVTTPSVFVKSSSNPDLKKTDFPDSLNELYKQIDLIKISWQISHKASGEEIVKGLKQDPWLKETYWDQGYEWGIIHEYLSGFINIQKLEDMLNPDYCKEQHYHLTIQHFVEEENPDDFLPFDITWDLTACLKKENGKIPDNIWLVHADGRAMYDMKISIEKYLELCYKAKGFHYWQLVYVLQEDAYENYELMKRFLPMLFPNVELDLSDFGIELKH